MKGMFWSAVHRFLPCPAIHLLCSLCRQEDICGKCWERKIESWGGYAMSPEQRTREEAEGGLPIALLSANGTLSTAQTITFKFGGES